MYVCHSDRLRGGRPFALGLSVRGHQGGGSRVSTPLLPLTALPGHRTPAYFVRQKASTSTVRPYRSYFGFPWWTKLRALLCWSWARLGKHVGDRISTRHALYYPVSLAAARGEAISNYLHRSGDCIRRRGRVGKPGLTANLLPLLLVVGSAFAFAMSNVLTKRYGPFDPLMLMGWSSLLTVPQVTLMSLLLEHGQLTSLVTADQRGWLALAYTIFIGGILGFGLWFWLIARCSMGRVAPFGLLLPVFAVISSVLLLGDHMTPKLIVGGLLAISGVAITQVRPIARPI